MHLPRLTSIGVGSSSKHSKLLEAFANTIKKKFSSLELVNDRKASSVWIREVIEDYQKSTDGVIAASKIGLSRMRESCTHVGDWREKLETMTVRPV